MVEFYNSKSINEASQHSPFGVMYGYQPSTRADRLLSLSGVTADAIDRLTLISDIHDAFHQLLQLSKERITTR